MGRTSKPAPQIKGCAFRIADSIPNVYSERLYELPGSLQDSLEFRQTRWQRSDCKSIQTETFNGNFGLMQPACVVPTRSGCRELQKRERGSSKRGEKHHPIEQHPKVRQRVTLFSQLPLESCLGRRRQAGCQRLWPVWSAPVPPAALG